MNESLIENFILETARKNYTQLFNLCSVSYVRLDNFL